MPLILTLIFVQFQQTVSEPLCDPVERHWDGIGEPRPTNCANAPYVFPSVSRGILPRFTPAGLEAFSILNGDFRIYINWVSPSQL